MLESAYAIKLNKTTIPNLSEQFLIDCDKINLNCNGGNTKIALEFLKNTTGMFYEGEYPYTASYNGCKTKYPTRNLGFPKLNSLMPAKLI